MTTLGTGSQIVSSYENTVQPGGSTFWPLRNRAADALMRIGVGSPNVPVSVTPNRTPAGAFIQTSVKPEFSGDPGASYTSGMHVESIVRGGSGGSVSSLTSIAYKSTGTYSGEVIIHGGEIGADARNSTDQRGIVTGLWAFAYGDRTNTAGVGTGIEINTFTCKQWNPVVNYSIDPFVSAGDRAMVGMLINNYQKGISDYGGRGGDYQNHYGIAVTSTGPLQQNGARGRSFGYQTGIYLSDCSMEAVRIRGGVFGEGGHRTRYGIRFEGTPMMSAGIALGPNKFNWGEGAAAGVVDKDGDMLYNQVLGTFFLNIKGMVGRLMTMFGISTAGNMTANRRIHIKIDGVDYYLLARQE